MPVSEQGITLDRYMLIPRTAIFLRSGNSYLLLKGAPSKRLWANRYNGLGGHVEPGEDVLSAARRELQEEAGITADLRLCGIVIVDTGQNPGVCLYIFTGECSLQNIQPSREGLAEWIPYEDLPSLPVVEDLPVLLGKVHTMLPDTPAFCARSFYDEDKKLKVVFA